LAITSWPILFVVYVAWTPLAQAQGEDVLLAHPEAPTTSVGWRGHVRGQVSVRIPIVVAAAHRGFCLSIEPLVELHNDAGSDQPLPNESWRGRLALVTHWERRDDDALARLRYVAFAVQHESDHQTARSGAGVDALQLNALALRAGTTLAPHDWGFHLRAEIDALVISCTRVASSCDSFRGSGSVGGSLDAALDLGAGVVKPTRWYFVTALHVGGVFRHDALVAERRAILQAGVWRATGYGRWQLLAFAWVGNDVGFGRARTVYQGGAAIRWSPR
jgi:hypothetical protein